jgi:2-ketocyclohexanecarboxyl-CoA hydrolase
VMNAFRLQTVEELIHAFQKANEERSVNTVVLAGAGDKAFCTGGDQKAHLSEDGLYGPRGTVGMPIEELQTAIRDVRKVSIARVQGFAIGGGNVFATLCDLTIASEKAVFGQVGPKVGSVDPGWGTALLARHVGEKKAREIWFLCRRYTAQQACDMGLVNKVVAHAELDAEVEAWAADINQMSPTALAIAKRSFNADSESIRGISFLGIQAVKHYYMSEESKEGVRAFNERRKADFKKFL